MKTVFALGAAPCDICTSCACHSPPPRRCPSPPWPTAASLWPFLLLRTREEMWLSERSRKGRPSLTLPLGEEPQPKVHGSFEKPSGEGLPGAAVAPPAATARGEPWSGARVNPQRGRARLSSQTARPCPGPWPPCSAIGKLGDSRPLGPSSNGYNNAQTRKLRIHLK